MHNNPMMLESWDTLITWVHVVNTYSIIFKFTLQLFLSLVLFFIALVI